MGNHSHGGRWAALCHHEPTLEGSLSPCQDSSHEWLNGCTCVVWIECLVVVVIVVVDPLYIGFRLGTTTIAHHLEGALCIPHHTHKAHIGQCPQPKPERNQGNNVDR